MTFPDWALSTLSTTSLVAILAWLSRQLIVTRLKASVQNEFNEKLETLRADLRKSEEAFKADLRAKEAKIVTLQSGALTVLASRQAALDKRRLEAIEQIWAGVEILGPMKGAVNLMQTVHFERSLEAASQDQKVRQFFSTVGQSYTPDKLIKTEAHKARPFISEIAWALFSGYESILLYSVTQLYMLKLGVNHPNFLKTDQVPNLVKVALPAYAEYIDKQGVSGCYYLLDKLEAELLNELQRMMRGEESNQATIEQAGKILEATKSMNEEISRNATASASVPLS